LKIFIAALGLRLFVHILLNLIFTEPAIVSFDSEEYVRNSYNLEVWDKATEKMGYTEWYQRTPGYTLFLYIVGTKLAIYLQLIISSLSVFLMYRMNKTAGKIWLFYPMELLHPSMYMKETLLIFIIISIIYVFKKHDYLPANNDYRITL
jgi:hypothetical protein